MRLRRKPRLALVRVRAPGAEARVLIEAAPWALPIRQVLLIVVFCPIYEVKM